MWSVSFQRVALQNALQKRLVNSYNLLKSYIEFESLQNFVRVERNLVCTGRGSHSPEAERLQPQ